MNPRQCSDDAVLKLKSRWSKSRWSFSLKAGAVVDVMARAGEWLNARYGQGREEWISAQYALKVN